jgi:hypothetical protein
MSRHVIAALSVATTLFTPGALAATVKNLDETEHMITVIEGSNSQDLTVKPGSSLEGICQKGCLLRLDGSSEDPYELEGTEVTTIEKGQLWGEDQEPPVPSVDGDTSGAPSPSPPP